MTNPEPAPNRIKIADIQQAVTNGARKFSALLKVLLVTAGSIVAVVFASLIISIVQFQARLSEARTQNGNITLESIQLIKDHQERVTQQYKEMRDLADKLGKLRADYLAEFNSTSQLIGLLCGSLDSERSGECFAALQQFVSTNNANIDLVLKQYRPATIAAHTEEIVNTSTALLKKALSAGILHNAQTQYTATQQAVQVSCQSLLQYVSDRLGATTLLAVSPELQITIQVQCYSGDYEAPGTASTLGQGAPTEELVRASSPQPDQVRADVRGVNRILLSELVFYYRFYSWLTSFLGASGHEIILAPPEFIIILLVIATGILGSFLFHTYSMFRADDPAKFPSFFAILLRGTLSVMCALVIFILARTGFVAITEGGQRAGEAMISPFVIAFVSVAAGLMAERAIERIRGAGISALEGRNAAASDARGA